MTNRYVKKWTLAKGTINPSSHVNPKADDSLMHKMERLAF